MFGIRRKAFVPMGLCAIFLAAGSAGTALASHGPITLDGSLTTGDTPDSFGASEVSVDATLADGVASGTLTTEGRTGGVGNFSHNEFSGKVTCMIAKGKRVIIGAFGKAIRDEEEDVFPFKETITPFPGSYLQVAVIESTDYTEGTPGGEVTVRHKFQSLGAHHEGIASGAAPNCKDWRSLQAVSPANSGDTLLQPPTITRPVGGSTLPTGKVKFAGKGEPDSSIELYEVGDQDEAHVVGVNAHGKWKTTITGLAPGSHEFTALTIDGSATPAKTVHFTVA